LPRFVTADSEDHGHGDASKLLKSDLNEMTKEEAQQIRHRLRLRLGAATGKGKLVSGKDLLEACSSLGLTRFSEDEMNEMLNAIGDFINLRLEESPESPSKTSTRGRPSSRARVTLVGQQGVRESLNMMGLVGTAASSESRWKYSTNAEPVWEWPEHPASSSVHPVDRQTARNYNMVPLQALTEVFLAHEGEIHKRIFGPRLLNQFKAVKEILLAGDTNRLVAELTFVRINDLAAPPEPTHPLMYLEPFVAILIVANGIMIGFQTDPGYENWEGFFYLEVVFAAFIWLEIFLRMHLLKCQQYWCGPERVWNYFDMFLALTGIADITLQIATQGETDIFGASLLRFCRLIRLVRIVKLFRVKFMKDLRLMVKGLVAGIRTLALAFSLLFGVLYVISGFATITIGGTATSGLERFFANIPNSMFTAYRCFSGECTNDVGQPIPSLLAEEYGLAFILPFVASHMLVTMGINNVILAVYVDITMRAAKENDATTAEQHSRESVRIARTTRELLKKFASAHHQFADDGKLTKNKSKFNFTQTFFTDEEINDSMEISKELFLLVIQDYSVQKMMDDLDLPHDRANLFEVIDADGSGTLKLTELVQGLLKIRGEINKSDTVAGLLAIKAVQSLLIDMKEESSKELELLRKDLQRQIRSVRAMPPNPTPRAERRGSKLQGPDLELLQDQIRERKEEPISLEPSLSRRPEAILSDVELQPPSP